MISARALMVVEPAFWLKLLLFYTPFVFATLYYFLLNLLALPAAAAVPAREFRIIPPPTRYSGTIFWSFIDDFTF